MSQHGPVLADNVSGSISNIPAHLVFRHFSSVLVRIQDGLLPFAPIVKKRPVLACGHPKALVDGFDRLLHLVDDVVHPSVLHKCALDFVARMVNSPYRYRLRYITLFLSPTCRLVVGAFCVVFGFASQRDFCAFLHTPFVCWVVDPMHLFPVVLGLQSRRPLVFSPFSNSKFLPAPPPHGSAVCCVLFAISYAERRTVRG